MLKGLTFLPSLALVAAMALPVAAETPNAETVVARVNGEEITLGHMILAHATLPEQFKSIPAPALFEAILEQLIQQTALKQAGPAEAPLYVELSLENERRALLSAEYVSSMIADMDTEDAVKAAYDAKYPDGQGEVEYNASHILLASKEEAEAVKAILDEGADFAETAKAKSTGPSGPGGGSLGWFGPGRMVPEFEQAVTSLEVGQISDPVATQFGWHVILLNDKRQAEAPALEDVRAELESEVRQAAIEAKVQELTDAATVDRPEIEGLDPSVLTNIDLVRN